MNNLAMRRAWLQVHKWIGLILAILIIPISLTGSALVWHDGLDRLVNPARYATNGDALLAPQAYVDAARTRLPRTDTVAQVAMPDDGGPVIVSAAGSARAQAGPPARTMVYLDPPTARVLDVASNRAGLVRVLHGFHGSLLVPGVGRQIVGWIGVAMMLSCFTGLWLWWPTAGKWVRGMRWRRHRNVDANLHHLTGFWIALPLFVLSLTGAWISFPAFFGALSGQSARGGPDRATMARARPLATPALTLDAVVARARTIGGGDLRAIAWPTDRSADWSITFADARVTVADDSGTAARAPERGQSGVARLMRRIHDGTGMGWPWQAIIFAGGVIPAILGVTGVIMWWRARSWKRALADRRLAKRETIAAE